MFQFPGFTFRRIGILCLQHSGLPHSDICGSTLVCSSPQLFAAYHVLLRLQEPRHPPYALICFLLLWLFTYPKVHECLALTIFVSLFFIDIIIRIQLHLSSLSSFLPNLSMNFVVRNNAFNMKTGFPSINCIIATQTYISFLQKISCLIYFLHSNLHTQTHTLFLVEDKGVEPLTSRMQI